MLSTIHLNIGSNSGDRREFISRAVAALHLSVPGFESMAVSPEVESPPWGFESLHPFCNVGVAVTVRRPEPWTEQGLLGLLDALKSLEKSISAMPHRNADGTYRDREIDIDIIAVDALVLNHPRLTLPHPHMATRAFVLEPMAHLAPTWHHPLTGLTPAEMMRMNNEK